MEVVLLLVEGLEGWIQLNLQTELEYPLVPECYQREYGNVYLRCSLSCH